jgi:hypothetical protein
MTPPRMPPWTASVHFPDLYPIDVFHLNFNFLFLLLLQGIYLNANNIHRAKLMYSTTIRTAPYKQQVH